MDVSASERFYFGGRIVGMELKAADIGFRYDKDRWIFRHITLELHSEEIVGLVAPSGSGKSTLAKLLSGYEEPSEGIIRLDGLPLDRTGYCPVQLIYQNPEKAVNPEWTMHRILTECGLPAREVLLSLKIQPEWYNRYPSELSGGELQRFCIARVLGLKTKFLIADEITTMFDAVTQAGIWKMLLTIARSRHMGILVITHDMALAGKVCKRIVRL
jgi:peptide/nickel transport system ATP-binding protein